MFDDAEIVATMKSKTGRTRMTEKRTDTKWHITKWIPERKRLLVHSRQNLKKVQKDL